MIGYQDLLKDQQDSEAGSTKGISWFDALTPLLITEIPGVSMQKARKGRALKTQEFNRGYQREKSSQAKAMSNAPATTPLLETWAGKF